MNPHRRNFHFLATLAGVIVLTGCGVMPRSEIVQSPSARAGVQPTSPLKQLSPKLAAQACVSTAQQLEAKDRLEDAIIQYERARVHQPNCPGISHRLAVLHDCLGNTESAWKEYQAALEESPDDADLLNDLGYFYFQRQQFSEAEKCFREVVKLEPGHARAWTNLGLTLGSEKRFDEAETAFQQASTPANAHYNMGIVYSQLGEFDKARTAFLESKRLDPALRQPEAILRYFDDHPELAISDQPNPH